jgi:DNA-binding GntR family transcriptional regulator
MTLRQKAYRAIKNKIIYFEVKPGEKILESKMARSLGIGRVPVREALTMLESERLILKTGGYGYLVAKLNSKEIDDYFTIRTQLEIVGINLLMKRATKSDLARLRLHVDKAVQIYQQKNIRKIIESDSRFHEMMYLATKSDVFYQTIQSLADKTIVMRAAALQSADGRQASIRDHLEIMTAVELRDMDKLYRVISEHLKYAPRFYEAIQSEIQY